MQCTPVSTDAITTPAASSSLARQMELQELLNFQQQLQNTHTQSRPLEYYPSYHDDNQNPLHPYSKDTAYMHHRAAYDRNLLHYSLQDPRQQPCNHHHPSDASEQHCDSHQDRRRRHERIANKRDSTTPPPSPPMSFRDSHYEQDLDDVQQPKRRQLYGKRKFEITERPQNHKRLKRGEVWDLEPAKEELRRTSPIRSPPPLSSVPSNSPPPSFASPASPPGIIVPTGSFPFGPSRSPSPQSPAPPFSPSPYSSPQTFYDGGGASEEETGDRWFRTSSVLLKMMEKMGFQWGKGLGKELQGVTELPGNISMILKLTYN